MCDQTAPPFCARPVISKILESLPSMCEAMPTIAEMVRTPVPPIPVSIILVMPSDSWYFGSGKSDIS